MSYNICKEFSSKSKAGIDESLQLQVGDAGKPSKQGYFRIFYSRF